jgi:hypothetical protein
MILWPLARLNFSSVFVIFIISGFSNNIRQEGLVCIRDFVRLFCVHSFSIVTERRTKSILPGSAFSD